MAILPRFLVSSAHDHCCHHDAESWSFHSVALIFVMIVGIGAFSRCCRSAGLFNFGKLVVGMSLMWAPFVYTAFAHHETAFTIAGASLVGWAHLTNLRNGGCHPAESKA